VVDEHLSDQEQLSRETRQEKRERRRARQKAQMLQHGKSLIRVYRNAVSKRVKTMKARKRSG